MEPGADWTTSDAILPVSFGVQYDTVDDLPTMIQEAQLHAGATFVVIPLASESSSSSFMPSTKSDLCLTSQQWYTHVVGCVTALFGNAHLLQQLDWAKHLALTAVLCDGPGDLDLISYASTLMALVRQYPKLQWWIPVEASAYTRWNRLMALCDTVTSHINPVPLLSCRGEAALQWPGEHVGAVIVESIDDVTRNRDLLVKLLQQDVRMTLSLKAESEHTVAFRDVLQVPLQPLADNLQSQTYEIFERDPVKYMQYEEAVFRVLSTRPAVGNAPSLVMVVGAGRGPLVSAALRASSRASHPISVVAIEKNPSACVTLRGMNADQWDGAVRIVEGDMRRVGSEYDGRALIVVSELLGSFSDNELSPECLQGAMRFLLNTDSGGVSIPSSYTSWIAPITCRRLWASMNSQLETLHVVNLHTFWQAADQQPCFTFTHDVKRLDVEESNERQVTLEFETRADHVTVHGFAGYFEAVLYEGDDRDDDATTISTVPGRATPGMFSWFPAVFPVRNPVQWEAGHSLMLTMRRRTQDKHVWYEWVVDAMGQLSPIHNANGQAYAIGL
ncbi:unnamed protein product (mitochondrion) [Plasmodiophora brassicae]|uniref:Protein arginine N-methyltransferase n=1 Tax=Plasmodiophora brassicae TaxID=37360 RepID=A0A3P3Y8G7_PLABS|nr:unnamed protein product [Plasmodiophora brassicae]